jgi:hypothetical protein
MAMNGAAQDLRRLAARIEQVTRESPAAAIAGEQVRALADYLTLRARVMELEGGGQQAPPRATERPPGPFPGEEAQRQRSEGALV